MTLSDYITANKLTLAQFGKLVGRSEATISRLTRGLNKPDWETMAAIIDATGGQVTPNDFIDVPSAHEAA